MPRRQTRRAAPTRSSTPARSAAPVPAVQQQQQPRQPGMLANIATTAAGVAVGHTIGHGMTSMLFGGGSGGNNAAQHQDQGTASTMQAQPSACDVDQKAFMRCLENSSNDISACQFYLDMVKQCQEQNRQSYN